MKPLSEKIIQMHTEDKNESIILVDVIRVDDLKEAIKEVKSKLSFKGEVNESCDVDSHMVYMGDVFKIINEIFGSELLE